MSLAINVGVPDGSLARASLRSPLICSLADGGHSVDEAVRVPGFDQVLLTDWNGDNQGPSDAATLEKLFKAISAQWPGAAVFASTFDNFTSQLEPFRQRIPVLTQEIGDTWIYGTPSDPIKHATMRASMRAWADYAADGGEQVCVASIRCPPSCLRSPFPSPSHAKREGAFV